MKKFRVGCSPLSNTIFAGNVLKDGCWGATKHDVTNDAVSSVAQHLLGTDTSLEFVKAGKRYRMSVVEIKQEEV